MNSAITSFPRTALLHILYARAHQRAYIRCRTALRGM